MTDTRQTTDIIDFSDIAPYPDSDFHKHMAELVEEPMFEHAVHFAIPGVDWQAFKQQLLQVQSKQQFHALIMAPFLEHLVNNTTHGVTSGGLDNVQLGTGYTYITNHRDIVLDASFLNLCLIRHGMPLTEVAIGDNLLIYPWITKLVKLNNSFIVHRGLKMMAALKAAKHLSGYIHDTTHNRNVSVWIAQREGRAKDSNDLTQEGVVKMLSLGSPLPVKESLAEINLLPVAISYEYDPNDYLKATEFLLRRRNPDFKKSKRDDLFSMETGLLSQKGRVHFEFTPCLSQQIPQIESTDKAEVVRQVCQMIDRQIHRGYKIFPGNYVAYDTLFDSRRFADLYTQADIDTFNAYIEGELAKVELNDVTINERQYMRRKILEMYANPLINKLKIK